MQHNANHYICYEMNIMYNPINRLRVFPIGSICSVANRSGNAGKREKKLLHTTKCAAVALSRIHGVKMN